MTSGHYGASVNDEVLTSALVRAVADLLDGLVDRLLRTDERVTSAAQGKALIAVDDDAEDLADRVQRFVAVATPAVRIVARGARFTRVPWVLDPPSSRTMSGVATEPADGPKLVGRYALFDEIACGGEGRVLDRRRVNAHLRSLAKQIVDEPIKRLVGAIANVIVIA